MDGYPKQAEKLQIIIKMWCPQATQHYDFRVEYKDAYMKDELLDVINELNLKLGKKVFEYKPDSTNAVIFKKNIDKMWGVGYNEEDVVTIGSTLCYQLCCGDNIFSMQLMESKFYERIKAKLLVWHELGHVAGLDHDDKTLEIMNSTMMYAWEYNEAVEQRYLSALKQRMGLNK
jgi:hypothetical protein